jgi:hypothetical protein
VLCYRLDADPAAKREDDINLFNLLRDGIQVFPFALALDGHIGDIPWDTIQLG